MEAEGVNRPWRSREEFEDFQRFVDDKRFTDLYCQVYRGGRSWYPSVAADDSPYRDALAQGFDPLQDTIKAAHKRGQRVHAWVNVLRIQNNPSLPLLKVVGPEALHVDSYGNSMLSYDEEGLAPGELRSSFQLETPGVWLDPSSKRARRFIVEAIRDVILSYPELDGIHLDMIRYPGTISRGRGGTRPDFGYSKRSVQGFFEFAGKKAPEPSTRLNSSLRNSAAWNAWRRAQVTLLVFEIKEMINEIAPELELSAAVIAAPDRAYGELYQDWTEWMRGKVIDTAVPMNYTRDNDLALQRSRHASRYTTTGQVLMGLGAWLMKGRPDQLAAQARAALNAGTHGVVLFSYSNLASTEGRETAQQFLSSVFAPR